MAKQLIGDAAAVSTSGVSHALRVERDGDTGTAVTVMGADGRKRHATAVLVDTAAVAVLVELLATAAGVSRDGVTAIGEIFSQTSGRGIAGTAHDSNDAYTRQHCQCHACLAADGTAS